MSNLADSPAAYAGSAQTLTRHALDRATGASLSEGNAVELLIDARANFDAWLAAIRTAKKSIILENYIVADDDVGREFLVALSERAAAGVSVAVIRDWLGCLGNSKVAFWQPLLDAGGAVRAYNPLRISPARSAGSVAITASCSSSTARSVSCRGSASRRNGLAIQHRTLRLGAIPASRSAGLPAPKSRGRLPIAGPSSGRPSIS